jgi:hypothetical protein
LHCHPCCATICSQLVQSLHCVPGRASSQTPPVCLPLITQTQVSCHVVPMSGWVLCPCSLSNCCSHLPLRLWPFLHDIDIVHILAIVGPQKIHTMTLMTISMVANSSEGLRDKAIMKQIHTLPSWHNITGTSYRYFMTILGYRKVVLTTFEKWVDQILQIFLRNA